MKYRAVVFDLDGTLIDSTDAIVQSFFHTFDVLGEPRPPREAVVASIGYVLEEQFGQLTHRDVKDCTRIYREHYGKVCCAQTTLMPGGKQALSDLAEAGIRLGFATSKRRYYAELILRHLGVLDCFEVRIGPDDVARPKPEPDAMLRAIELFGLPPDQLVLIGDTHFDVLCARGAGVDCIGVTTGYATRSELEALAPEAVYDSLGEAARHIIDANRAAHEVRAEVH